MIQNSYLEVLPEGYRIQWYELLTVLSQSEYAITYLALDKNLDKNIALKEYLPKNFATRDINGEVHPINVTRSESYRRGLESFLREARALTRINHPNIVHVLSVLEQNNTAYMAMQYEQGQNLTEIYKQADTPFREDMLLKIFVPILDGLALVHKEGFIHGQINLASIYIREDNSPVLLDFGQVPQTVEGEPTILTNLTAAGYAPIEQYRKGDGKQGPWTDIYDIAACLHAAIRGRPPENSPSRAAAIENHNKDIYQPLSASGIKNYTRNFLLAIDYGLRFQPEDRPHDILEWSDMLLGKKNVPDLGLSVKNNANQLTEENGTVLAPSTAQHQSSSTEITNKSGIQRELDEDRTVAMPPAHELHPEVNEDKTVVMPPHTPAPPLTATSKGDSALLSATALFSPKLSSIKPKTPSPPQRPINPPAPKREAPYRPIPELGYITEQKERSLWMLGPILLVVVPIAFAAVLFLIFVKVPNQPPLTDKGKVAQLLAQAQQDMAENRLIEPTGEAALNRYQKVLDIDPNNREAQQGLDKILQRLGDKVKQNIESNQLDKAETQLSAIEAVAPLSPATFTLRQMLNTARNLAARLPNLLEKARLAFNEKKYLPPADKNAYQLYTQVLNIDPGNQEAKQAITQMTVYYETRAKRLIDADKFKEAEQTINKLEILSAESAANLRLQLEERTSTTQAELSEILKQGDQALNADRLTVPANKSALYYYQRVLQTDSKNKRALKGIQSVYSRLESLFNKQLEKSEFAKAEKLLNTIKNVAPNTKLAARVEQRYLRLGPPAKSDKDIIGDLVTQFKHTLESQDLKNIDNLSEFQEGRQQFVQQFFDQYNSFQVNVSDVHYFANDHKAIAKISLSHLINKKGNVVKPGPWGDFEIEISKNEQDQWKVHW